MSRPEEVGMDAPTTVFKDTFSEEVWSTTYKDHNDQNVDDTMWRVAQFVGSAEETPAARNQWADEFYDMLSEFKCTAGGRIYANAGTEWGGTTLMNCFSPEVEVITKDGPKQICDVEIGDMVLTHKGRFRKVVNTLAREYVGPVQRFRSTYMTGDIVSTPEHPYYQGGDKWITSNEVSSLVLAYKSNTSEDINTLDIALILNDMPISVHEEYVHTEKSYVGGNGLSGVKTGQPVNRFINVDEDFAYLLGRFVGDGCTFKNNPRSAFDVDAFTIAFNATTEREHAENMVSLFERTFGVRPNLITSQNNTLYVRKASQIVALVLRRLIGGGFASKRIPDVIWAGSKGIQESFLRGLYDADGFVTDRGFLSLEMSNEKLISEVQALNLMAGVPSSRRLNRLFVGATHSIEFRSMLTKVYEDNRLEYVPSKNPSTGPVALPEGGFAFVPERIDEEYSGFVFNLSVEEDESYVVNNVVVHNCFVSPRGNYDIDSLPEIIGDVENQAQTLKSEGGWGQNFSWLRPRGAFINGIGVETPGAVKYMEIYDKVSDVITSGSGRKSLNKKAKGKIRKGAMMGVLDVWHPDVEEFIRAKQTAGRLSKFNVSVNCTDEFMGTVLNVLNLKAAGVDEDVIEAADQWILRFPDTTHPKYKEEWNGDIGLWERNGYPTVEYRRISALGLWNMIMESTYNRAEPGVLFLDRANYFGPLNYLETIFATNPCGEQTLAPGGVCNLGSVNLTQFVKPDGSGFDVEKIAHYTRVLVRFLDNINSLSNAPLPEYLDSMRNKRRIGVGILGWGSALFMLKVRFGSARASELREQVMSTIAREAYISSIDLAEEKGMFEYCEPKKHSEGVFIQSLNLPEKNIEKMRKVGIRNSSLLSVQPTGNCVTGDSVIKIDDRYVSIESLISTVTDIENLMEGDIVRLDSEIEINTFEGKALFNEIYVNGIQPILEIKLEDDTILKQTCNHKYLVKVNDDFAEWVEAKDLKKGMKIIQSTK